MRALALLSLSLGLWRRFVKVLGLLRIIREIVSLILILVVGPEAAIERYKLALDEDHRTAALLLAEQTRTSEVLDERFLALNPGVGNLTDLLALEVLPALAVEALVEAHHVIGAQEIDERISDIAPILQRKQVRY